MGRFLLSLSRELCGYYVLFLAPDKNTVRKYAAKYYGKIWCSVYTEDEVDVTEEGFKGIVNTNYIPVEIDEWDVE